MRTGAYCDRASRTHAACERIGLRHRARGTRDQRATAVRRARGWRGGLAGAARAGHRFAGPPVRAGVTGARCATPGAMRRPDGWRRCSRAACCARYCAHLASGALCRRAAKTSRARTRPPHTHFRPSLDLCGRIQETPSRASGCDACWNAPCTPPAGFCAHPVHGCASCAGVHTSTRAVCAWSGTSECCRPVIGSGHGG